MGLKVQPVSPASSVNDYSHSSGTDWNDSEDNKNSDKSFSDYLNEAISNNSNSGDRLLKNCPFL